MQKVTGVFLLALLCACAGKPAKKDELVTVSPVSKSLKAEANKNELVSPMTGTLQSVSSQAIPDVALLPINRQLFDQGLQWLAEGKADDALVCFGKVQLAQPDFAPAYLNAALAERQRKKLDAALTHLDAALANNLKQARIYVLQGLIERERGQFLAARQAYENALLIDADDSVAHRNLAILADLYLQDVQLAYQHMLRYTQRVPEDKTAQGWLSEIKRRAGIKDAPPPVIPVNPEPADPSALEQKQ